MSILGKFDKKHFLLTIADLTYPKNKPSKDKSILLKINQHEILNSTMCRFPEFD